jgi:hypothetical protein
MTINFPQPDWTPSSDPTVIPYDDDDEGEDYEDDDE